MPSESVVRKAGAIAFRTDGAEPEFVLVTAKRHPERWIFPKGHIEPGESDEQAALRELREEAGVRGEPIKHVGTITVQDGNGPVEIAFYLVRYQSEGAPERPRRRTWLPYAEARRALFFEESKQLLDRAVRMLAA